MDIRLERIQGDPKPQGTKTIVEADRKDRNAGRFMTAAILLVLIAGEWIFFDWDPYTVVDVYGVTPVTGGTIEYFDMRTLQNEFAEVRMVIGGKVGVIDKYGGIHAFPMCHYCTEAARKLAADSLPWKTQPFPAQEDMAMDCIVTQGALMDVNEVGDTLAATKLADKLVAGSCPTWDLSFALPRGRG